MNKNSVMLIGCGRAGNVIVNELMSRDHRYVGLMINSSLGDMSNLSNYDLADHYLFAGKDGSGKDRAVAKEFVKKRIHSLADTLIKYENQKIAIFFTSTSGGTGSGSTPLIIKALKKACPDKKIMLVAIMPNLAENEISLRNTIDFWNDMIDLKNKNLVNTIYLVDNNKRQTYEEINEAVADTLDSAFNLNNYDNTGMIDQGDSEVINTANGYSFIMPLSNKFTDIQEAIDDSVKNSVFMIPKIYDCDYLGAVLQENIYKIDDLKKKFEIFKIDYCGYSDNKNLVVLGGLPIPKEGIEFVEMALKDNEKRISRKYTENDLYVKTDSTTKKIKETKKEETKISTSTVSADKLNQIFNDNFWDD